MKTMINLLAINLKTFDKNPNKTTDSGMSVEMKEFYAKHLIETAQPKLVHDQWAVKEDIPKNGGKTIEFRGFKPLPKATTPLQEGVTPTGKKLEAYSIKATVEQYGDYVTLTDMVMTTTIDPMLVKANKELARQAGKTLDTVSREVLNSGTSVQYHEGQVLARNQLVGGAGTGNHYLSSVAINRAVTTLKGNDAPPAEGEEYVGIVHPHVAGDLREDPDWVKANEYAGSDKIFNGEIGKLHGVRFVETTEAKVFTGAGKDGRDVYSTVIVGSEAYGTTKLEGLGLQSIIKQLGSGGTTDPLNQRGTAGWKSSKVTTILVDLYLIRIETASRMSA